MKFLKQNDAPPASAYMLVMVLVIAGTFLFGSLVGMAFVKVFGDPVIYSKNELFLMNLLPFLGSFFLLWLGAKQFLKKPLNFVITVRNRMDLKRFFTSFLLWFSILFILFLLTFNLGAEQVVWNFQADKFALLLLISIVLIPIQTGVEEIFFRGILLQFFGRLFPKGIWAVVLSALLFGFIHLANPEVGYLGWYAVIFYVGSGLFTALLTVMDDGLELSWGFHAANNFYGVLIITNNWQVLKTDALFIDLSKPHASWEMIVILTLFYPLLLFIFAKLYGWKNWKERLFNNAITE